MRILVHGASVPRGSRIGLAALGLALRGHQVVWAGGAAPELPAGGPRILPGSFEPGEGGLAVARRHAEVVLGGSGGPLAAAAAAWLSRAHCLVLDLDAAALARWDWRARWAWGSLYAVALVPPGEAGAIRSARPPVPLERLALWSDGAPPPAAAADHLDTEILERACERSLARQLGEGLRAAAFLDRDGTLVAERGYLSDPAEVELLPGAAEAVRSLRAAGLAAVVISNQSGVGRGLFSLARVYEAMAALRHALRAHGAELDAIYFCPHAPDAGCACRKPGTGLVERAAEDLQLSLRRSVFVGDKLLDIETGHRAGMRSVLVRTGYGRDEEGRRAAQAAGRAVPGTALEPGAPDRVCDDLLEAAKWTLASPEIDRPE